MKKTLISLAAVGALISVSGVHARDLGITAEVGTTGLGFHLVAPIKDNLNARFGVNAFNRSFNEETNDASYDVSLKLRTFDALLDYYPMGGGFRVTGGVIYNGNRVTARAEPTGGTYTFNGNVYTSAQVGQVDGRIDFNNVAPYLGIGFGNALAPQKGWGFSADLGVMFQGSPEARLSSSGCTAGAAVCSQLASDLAAESRDLNDEVRDLRYYPVLRVGVSYKF